MNNDMPNNWGVGPVLLVEDDRTQADALSMMLDLIGWSEVVIARNGVEALALIEGAEPPFRAVITDWGMPSMDGLEFIEKFRKLPQGKITPVVLVTFFRRDEGSQHPGLATADSVLFKPIDLNDLTEGIKTALDKY